MRRLLDTVRTYPRQALAAVVLVLFAAAVVIWRSRIGADFWPPDSSRVGPNILAELVQVGVLTILAVLVWPPARRRADRLLELTIRPLHEHQVAHRREQREHNEWSARHIAEMYEKHTGKPPDAHPQFDLTTDR